MKSICKSLVSLSPLLFYIFGSWFLRAAIAAPGISRTQIYRAQLIPFFIVSLLYFINLTFVKQRIMPRWVLVIIALMSPLLTASVMQTDLYRYIWDGLNGMRGINPYSLRPLDSAEFNSVWWVSLINFPELPTIYPPASQLIFSMSAAINPFFWSHDGITPLLAKSLWQVEFSWSIVVGIFAAWTIYLTRKEFREFVLFNPLFILCVIGNKHIEVLLLPFIVLLANHRRITKNRFVQSLILFLAIGIKWLPILWLPIIYRQLSWVEIKKQISILVALLSFLFLAYSPSVIDSLLTSSGAFAKEWRFFSSIYEIVTATLIYFRLDALLSTKLLCLCLGGVWCLYLLKLSRSQQLSTNFLLIWLMIPFYLLIPTVNPWYLLPLLLLGSRHFKILWTPIFWPATCFVSQYYYINNEFPPILQSSYYVIIFSCIARDLYISRYKLKFSKRLNPSPLIRGRKATAHF